MNATIEWVIAQLVERVAKNYITTIAGVLSLAAGILSLPQFATFIDAAYKPYLGTAAAILMGVVGMLAKDKTPTATK